MGTFIARTSALVSGGASFILVPPAANTAAWYTQFGTPVSIILAMQSVLADLRAELNSVAIPVSFADTLRFQVDDIYLDGAVSPVSFSGLPAGFNLLSAFVSISDLAVTVTPPVTGTAEYFLQQANGTEGEADTPIFPYDMSFPQPTMLEVINNGIGLRVAIAATAAPGFSQIFPFYNFFISGEYEIISFDWTLENAGTPVQIGDEVRIVNNIAGAGGLAGVSKVCVSFVDGGVLQTFCAIIDTHTDDLITFLIPSGLGEFTGPTTLYVTLYGNGIQFTGSVTLQTTLQLLFLDASGIYTLIKNKKTDTIYDRDNPGQTLEVKIPNPYARTGLVGG